MLKWWHETNKNHCQINEMLYCVTKNISICIISDFSRVFVIFLSSGSNYSGSNYYRQSMSFSYPNVPVKAKLNTIWKRWKPVWKPDINFRCGIPLPCGVGIKVSLKCTNICAEWRRTVVRLSSALTSCDIFAISLGIATPLGLEWW